MRVYEFRQEMWDGPSVHGPYAHSNNAYEVAFELIFNSAAMNCTPDDLDKLYSLAKSGAFADALSFWNEIQDVCPSYIDELELEEPVPSSAVHDAIEAGYRTARMAMCDFDKAQTT